MSDAVLKAILAVAALVPDLVRDIAAALESGECPHEAAKRRMNAAETGAIIYEKAKFGG